MVTLESSNFLPVLMSSFFAFASNLWRRYDLAAIVLSTLCVTCAHTQVPAGASTVSGNVRDSQGKAIESAVVQLQTKEVSRAFEVHSDARGEYRFTDLREGVYTLRAVMSGHAGVTLPAFALGSRERKNLDITLGPAVPPSKSSAARPPEFFDPPQFTVAGVKDTTSLGGHGSAAAVQTQEALAEEIASLVSPEPNSPTNIVATQMPSGDVETHLREEVEHSPGCFAANHRLGEMLVREGRARAAIPFLERARALNPVDYDNSYDLALANADAGDDQRALKNAKELLVHHDTAELHHLVAGIEEKLGDSLAAVHEYERAAELDPRETYLFDWGSELLLHHAPEPAVQVFREGNRLYPRSGRMLIGLGIAWFAEGSFDQAVQRICEASDLDPSDPAPYLFLGGMQKVESSSSNQLMEKFHRFVTLQPQNSEANYYYAITLWKLRKSPADKSSLGEIETLLDRAIELNPSFAAAHLQLGILDAEQEDYLKAISQYERAIEADPQLPEAHYRLAQAYRLNGDEDKAKAELNVYQVMTRQATEREARERQQIRQFVYTLRDQPRPQTPESAPSN